MKILLQKINVISPGSIHHMKIKDILIEDGLIKKTGDAGTIDSPGAKTISGENYFVSSGWFDLHVNFREPGSEYKEDIESGCKAAMAGGFTGVLLMPSTNPVVSGKPAIEFIKTKTAGYLVDVHPAGSLSVNCDGKDLSEMYDMSLAGTKVFTDDKKSVQDAALMTRALQYAHNFGGRILSFAEDKNITGKGQVNEGITAVSLGLKGAPSMAEEIMISRDLSLAEYSGTPLHFSTISTAGSVALIRAAKAKGLKITADVSALHLSADESALAEFETVYKVKPPLRTKTDIEALLEGLKDGTIDCITSDHQPEDAENKIKEFELAAFGAGGLETAFAGARTATKNYLSVAELVSKFTTHPRFCAALKTDLIEDGQPANLTVFNPDLKWKVEEKDIRSKSKNNPFIGKELFGKAIAVINNNQLHSIS